MSVTSVWIVNRAGGLAYYRAADGTTALGSNDCLVIASTLQSVHAISARVSPAGPSSGMQSVAWRQPYCGGARDLTVHCVQTHTGSKMLATAGPDAPAAAVRMVLRRLHKLYADYALKSPFYTPDMPVRCDLFDAAVSAQIFQSSL